jgi:hypothetical protein
MTIPSPALAGVGREPPLRLLLTACGRHGGIVALMEEAAPVIAAALALPLRHLADPEAPPEAKISHINVFYSHLHHICNFRVGPATKKGYFWSNQAVP